MIVTVLGKRYNLRFVPNLGDKRGDCDSPSTPNKEIRIWQGVKGEERLEVLIHELAHASCWPLDEEYVAKFAEDTARALWRLGYRNEEISNG